MIVYLCTRFRARRLKNDDPERVLTNMRETKPLNEVSPLFQQ